MLDPENCVARLRFLAEKLSRHAEGAVPAVLADALDTNPNTIEFHRRIVSLVELGGRARIQITDLADDPSHDLYVEAIDGIVTTFEKLDMRNNCRDYAPAFNPRVMTLLETCERFVGRRLTTAPPEEEVLSEALTDVQEAISGILEADIEAETRQLLLEMLREVEGALLSYHISGLAGLRRVVERTLGAAILHRRLFEQSRAPGVMTRAFKALGRVLSVLQTLDFMRQLPERVRDIFSLPS